MSSKPCGWKLNHGPCGAPSRGGLRDGVLPESYARSFGNLTLNCAALIERRFRERVLFGKWTAQASRDILLYSWVRYGKGKPSEADEQAISAYAKNKKFGVQRMELRNQINFGKHNRTLEFYKCVPGAKVIRTDAGMLRSTLWSANVSQQPIGQLHAWMVVQRRRPPEGPSSAGTSRLRSLLAGGKIRLWRFVSRCMGISSAARPTLVLSWRSNSYWRHFVAELIRMRLLSYGMKASVGRKCAHRNSVSGSVLIQNQNYSALLPHSKRTWNGGRGLSPSAWVSRIQPAPRYREFENLALGPRRTAHGAARRLQTGDRSNEFSGPFLRTWDEFVIWLEWWRRNGNRQVVGIPETVGRAASHRRARYWRTQKPTPEGVAAACGQIQNRRPENTPKLTECCKEVLPDSLPWIAGAQIRSGMAAERCRLPIHSRVGA
jgi:hypothetical protein